MQTENSQLKTSLFNDKEHFLSFRQSWKDFVNNGGKPNCAQHLIYNGLRGKDISKSFSPITNHNKLTYSGMTPYGSYYSAVNLIKHFVRSRSSSDWMKKRYEQLIEPFGDHVSEEMIIKMVDSLPTKL